MSAVYPYVVKLKLTGKDDPNRVTMHDVRVNAYHIQDAVIQAFYDLSNSNGKATLEKYHLDVVSITPDQTEADDLLSLLKIFAPDAKRSDI